jgi:DNA-binding CsgD family transcriptional regulator
VVLGLVRARRGEADSEAPLAEAAALARASGEIQRLAPVASARAEVAWLSGARFDGGAASDEALALAVRNSSRWVAGELAYWRRQIGLDDALPPVALAEPWALSIGGHPAAASERWAALGCPYEAALTLAGHEHDDAGASAIQQLQLLGASAAVAVVTRRLRERGVRRLPRGPRPATRANPAGLTARELEVLELLAERLSNAQIAGRLVLSEKTVEHHVSSVLRKLDARSRHEASAAAAQLGIVAPG